MGVVLNQSFQNVVTTYMGFAVGAINVLLLYPNFLEPEHYGLITFLLSASTLVWPVMGFGMHNTLIKFYTSYKEESEKQKLLGVVLILPLIVGAVLGGIGLLFYKSIQLYFSDSELVQPYVWLIFVIALSIAYFEVFFAWGKIKLKSVFGNFMREVFHRVCVTVLLTLFYFEIIGLEGFIYLLTGVYLIRTLIILIYAFRLLPPKLVFALPSNKGSVFKYSFLILIAGSIATALLDLDKVMIEHYLPIENVSVYGIAVYIASVIAVPARAMQQITNPITASFLNTKDKEGLRKLYKKSSVTLLVVSGLIFILIVTNVNQLYQLIPEEYQIDVSIIILLSSTKLYDNLLGNNNSILFNSDYYRLVLLSGIFIVALAFVLNMYFIPEMGIFGAALATVGAFFLYNSVKLWFVYDKFKIHPFTGKTLPVVLLIALTSVLFYFIDINLNPVINILLKSAVVSLFYIFIAYLFNFSEDITQVINKVIKKQTP